MSLLGTSDEDLDHNEYVCNCADGSHVGKCVCCNHVGDYMGGHVGDIVGTYHGLGSVEPPLRQPSEDPIPQGVFRCQRNEG